MTFEEILDQAIAMLQRRGRLTYGTLKRQFQLDDAALEDLKNELIEGQRLAVDERGNVLVWTGAGVSAPHPITPSASSQDRPPRAYTPQYLAEKVLHSRSALEGERKQVTVLFADLKGSMELLADRDPEEARHILDPVLERLMAAVHRYEGTVNQIMGDGIMALFGAPLAHEDHAVRACYTALAMQDAIRRYSAEVRRTHALQGRLAEGRALLEEGMRESRRTGALHDQASQLAGLSEVCRLAGRGEEARQHARQALNLARQLKQRRVEALALRQLGVVHVHAAPPMSHRPKPTTVRPSPSPTHSVCARSRPTATTVSACCMPRPVSTSRPVLNYLPPSSSIAAWRCSSGCPRRRRCWRRWSNAQEPLHWVMPSPWQEALVQGWMMWATSLWQLNSL
jgi:class 3 adenylate cyclase